MIMATNKTIHDSQLVQKTIHKIVHIIHVKPTLYSLRENAYITIIVVILKTYE